MHESHRIDTALRDSMNALHSSGARPLYGGGKEGGPSNLAVLFALLKKRTDNHSSMAKLRIRHVRETPCVCFIGMRAPCRRVYRATNTPEREKEGTEKGRETELEGNETNSGRKREKGAKERELGQHYPAIKSLG